MALPSPLRTTALAIVATVALGACSTTPDAAPPVTAPSPTETPAAAPVESDDPLPSEPLDTAPIVASWEPGATPVDLGDGYSIGDCEGDMPSLCVMADGANIGFLEWSTFPVPTELLDLTGENLDRALREFSAARVAENEQDRRDGCGADHEVRADAPGTMTIGGSPGLRYGFVTMTGETVVEYAVTWVTVRGDELLVVVAHAATPGSCMASELLSFPPDELGFLLPVLDRVMTGTPLPA